MTQTDLPARLARAYSSLIRGILYPGSEGDEPYHGFSVSFNSDVAVTPDAFRSATGLGRLWEVEIETADRWFAETIAHCRDPGGRDDQSEAVAYEHLERAMNATLEGPLQRASVHWAAETFQFHKARYYVVGRVAGGGLAGVMAFSVET